MRIQTGKKKIIYIFLLIALVVSVLPWREAFQSSNVVNKIKHGEEE